MAKKEIPEDEGVSQAWLASYADAMTLLLAFFIMMFAFGLIDEGKFTDFKAGVTAVLGVPDPATDNSDSILSSGQGVTPEVAFSDMPTEEEQAAADAQREALAEFGEVTAENVEELKALLEFEFAKVGASESTEVGIDERGVFVRFNGRALFPSGSAELDADGLTLLATAADVLGVIENRLEIEGHTDSQPTGSGWPSNWELSGARSARVVRWMIEPGGIEDPRLSSVGLADTRPQDSNATSEGRDANRRVEIVVRVAGLTEAGVPVIDPELSDPVGIGAPDEATPATDPNPAAADPIDTTVDPQIGGEAVFGASE